MINVQHFVEFLTRENNTLGLLLTDRVSLLNRNHNIPGFKGHQSAIFIDIDFQLKAINHYPERSMPGKELQLSFYVEPYNET